MGESTMSTAAPPEAFSLRALPLPAKLVISVFLMAVGLGYTSAMIQLHMGHSSKEGSPLPSPSDVVAIFAGKVWKNGGDPRTIGRLEAIIGGDPNGELDRSNMTPAFFGEDKADFKKLIAEKPTEETRIRAEREGERKAVAAWIVADAETRKKAYADDAFPVPAEMAGQPITPGFEDKAAIKIHSLIDARCARCHKPGGAKAGIPLDTYDGLAKFIPMSAQVPPGGGWVDSGRQMSVGALTQSTHAHLLSFAVLFSLTGLTFAFTSFPRIVRVFLAPIVLVAQVADVSCWWLARLPDCGPYFAHCILLTGGIVGVGLGAQIVLSLFNMYGWKGKVVLGALFLAAGAAGGLAWNEVIAPYLKEEADAKTAQIAAEKAKADKKNDPTPKKNEGTVPKNVNVAVQPKNPVPVAMMPCRLEKVLSGEFDPESDVWGGEDGGMVRAFYNKEKSFKALFEKVQAAKGTMKPDETAEKQLDQLKKERKAEQDAFLAWIKAAAADPKVAQETYEGNKFLLPPALKDLPITPDFKGDGPSLKVKTLIDARCARCHNPKDKPKDYPLTNFTEVAEYLKP